MKTLALYFVIVGAAFAQAGAHPEFRLPSAGAETGQRAFTTEMVAAGKTQYGILCTGCHGPTGEGGRGPSLLEGRNVRRASDGELFSMIHDGIPGSDMPPFPVPDKQVWSIVAYLRSLTSPAFFAKPTGDAAAGEKLYQASGCSGCHAIVGQGGALGPDLSNIGLTHTLLRIREGIVEPNKRITDGYEPVVVKRKDGTTVKGVVKSRTNYRLHVLDGQGTIHAIDASDVAALTLPDKSWMREGYLDRLGEGGLADVIAFLSRQTLSPEPAREDVQ